MKLVNDFFNYILGYLIVYFLLNFSGNTLGSFFFENIRYIEMHIANVIFKYTKTFKIIGNILLKVRHSLRIV